MSERKVRKRRKESVFSGQSVQFKTNNGPLHFLKLLFTARWSMPSGISTVLLMIYVFVYSSNFLILLNPLDALESLTFSRTGAGGAKDIRADDIELFKANIGIVIYACVALYSLFFIKRIVKVLRAHPHIVVIVALLLFSMTYSVNPQQVLYSTIQVFIGVLIALVYALENIDKERWDRRFCKTILFPLVLVHTYSLVLFFANEINLIDFMQSTARFGGLPGNPNVAGASAVIGIWTSAYLLLNSAGSHRKISRLAKLYYFTAVALFVFTIVTSASGTAITVSIVVVAILVWLKFLGIFKDPVKRMGYIIAGVLAMMLMVGYLLVNNTTEELNETFTSSLGKESDFTGRTDLWEIAVAAIKEKPVFGWSFDYHETIQENRKYELPDQLAHFHNGFLDTAVAGGLILLAVMLWNMFSYIRYSFKSWPGNAHLYGFIGPVVILILMNLSEYSLLRPLSVIFEFYLCAYFLLVISSMEDEDLIGSGTKKAAPVVSHKVKSTVKRSSNAGKRYRF